MELGDIPDEEFAKGDPKLSEFAILYMQRLRNNLAIEILSMRVPSEGDKSAFHLEHAYLTGQLDMLTELLNVPEDIPVTDFSN